RLAQRGSQRRPDVRRSETLRDRAAVLLDAVGRMTRPDEGVAEHVVPLRAVRMDRDDRPKRADRLVRPAVEGERVPEVPLVRPDAGGRGRGGAGLLEAFGAAVLREADRAEERPDRGIAGVLDLRRGEEDRRVLELPLGDEVERAAVVEVDVEEPLR